MEANMPGGRDSRNHRRQRRRLTRFIAILPLAPERDLKVALLADHSFWRAQLMQFHRFMDASTFTRQL